MSSNSASVKPDQRASQQRAERQRVAAIGERSRQSDEILDLLTPEEALARLGRNRDAAILERLLESPELGADRRKQRDVAQTAGPHRAVIGRCAHRRFPTSRLQSSATRSASASRF